MNVSFVNLKRQYQLHKTELDSAFERVMNSCAFVGGLNNPEVKTFEENFAAFLGMKYCIACGNGTDALEISLRSMGIGPGDEVIVPAMTWISTAECVAANGATPVFADIDPITYTIDPAQFEAKITQRTKAVIPVHLYGQPANMPEICRIAEQYSILILEDCAQAHGAKCCGKNVGSFGSMAEFSFYPGKNLGAFGDAGGIVTNDDAFAEKARMIAQHGQTGQKFHHKISGRNSRMDGLQAAVLNVKLPYLENWNKARTQIAKQYLAGIHHPDIVLPSVPEICTPVWHLFAVMTPRRDEFRKKLSEAGIQTGQQYPVPLPFTEAYAALKDGKDTFPVSTRVSQQVMTLPIFPEMTDDEVEYVIEKVNDL